MAMREIPGRVTDRGRDEANSKGLYYLVKISHHPKKSAECPLVGRVAWVPWPRRWSSKVKQTLRLSDAVSKFSYLFVPWTAQD